MSNEALVFNYTNALLDVVSAENGVKECQDALTLVSKNIDAEIITYLSAYAVEEKDKVAVLELLGADLKTPFGKFLHLLAMRHRFTLWPRIQERLMVRLEALQGRKVGYVFMAQPLTAAQLKTLDEAMSGVFGHPVLLLPRIDARLVGGFKIAFDDQVYDYSYRTQLSQLYDDLRRKEEV